MNQFQQKVTISWSSVCIFCDSVLEHFIKMYHDDSTTEIKLTDVTHCDLETKSILKPPKVRAPLQEVDLGNQIYVEFDVIRKRRVSFAGVNKIKEFNSEAKSFCIYNTPVYEEKVSTSSDSSALSNSASGNIINFSKENETTILNDTMDLTDLSIVQPSCAMDITFMKPQNTLPGVQDIFASKSQVVSDDKVSRNQFDQQGLQYRNNEGITDSDPLGIFSSHTLAKPKDKGPIFNPAKALLNEMLEDSVADNPILDQYLKPNSLFAQNKFTLPSVSTTHATLTDCKTTLSAAENIEVIPMSVNKTAFPVTTVEANSRQKNDDSFQYLNSHKNRPLLFGSYNLDRDESSKITKRTYKEVLQMEFSEAVPSSKHQALENQVAHYENKSVKALNASQMEFTEVLPLKNFQAMQNLNTDNRSLANTGNVSLMEFTEALPLRGSQVVTNKLEQESLFVNKNKFTSNMKNENSTFLSSHMEFTEVLPVQKLIRDECKMNIKDKVDEIQINELQSLDVTSSTDNNNPLQSNMLKSTKGCFQENVTGHTNQNDNLQFYLRDNIERSSEEVGEKSQMEFTEVLPSLKHCVVQGSLKSEGILQGIGDNILPKNEVIKSEKISLSKQLNESNSMDVTELNNIPTKLENIRYEIDSHQNNGIWDKRAMTFHKPIFGFTNEGNTSRMDFTEALPNKNDNSNIIETNQENLENNNVFMTKKKSLVVSNENNILEMSSCMEFTEALPLQKQQNLFKRDVLICDNVKSGDICEEKENMPHLEKENLKVLNTMDITESDHFVNKIVCNNPMQNYSVAVSIGNNIQLEQNNPRFLNEHQTSQMEFTEVLPLKNIPNVINDGNQGYSKTVNFCSRKSMVPSTNNCTFETSNMEITEVLPMHKLKQASTSSQVTLVPLHENISPSDCILKSEKSPSLSKNNLEDPCSMDVSGTNNITDHDNFKSNIDENKENVVQTTCTNIVESDIRQKKSSDLKINPQNISPLFASSETVGEIQDISQMEFTEAIPHKNVQIIKPNMRKSIMVSDYTLGTSQMEFTEAIPGRNTDIKQFVSDYKDIETEPAQNVVAINYNLPLESEILNNSCSMDVANIGDEVLSKEKDQLNQNDGVSADSNLSCCRPDLRIELNQKPQMETVAEEMSPKKPQSSSFISSSPNFYKNAINVDFKQEKLPMSYNATLEKSAIDSTQMDFTKDLRLSQLQIENQGKNVQVSGGNKADNLFNFVLSDIKPEQSVNRTLETSQMEITEATSMQKPLSQPETSSIYPSLINLNPKIVEDNLNTENIPPILNHKLDTVSSVDDGKMDFSETVQSTLLKQNENIHALAEISSGKSNNQSEASCETNTIPLLSQKNITEDIIKQESIAFIDTQKSNCLGTKNVVPIERSIEIDTSKLNQNAIDHDKPQLNQKELESRYQSKNDPETHLAESFSEITISNAKVENINDMRDVVSNYEPASSTRNLNSADLCITNFDKLFSIANDKDNYILEKVHPQKKKNVIDSIVVRDIQTKNNVVDSQQPLNIEGVIKTDGSIEGKRTSLIEKTSGIGETVLKTSSEDIIKQTKVVDAAIDVVNVSHKKSLVHFNTPPIRNTKKRRTMGPLSPSDCRKLFQTSPSDSTQCSNDVSDVNNLLSTSQKRGMLKEERKLDYDLDKGKEEWERLVKNDLFMKKHSFEFLTPVRWKYKFKWPLEVVLEIPDIEVNESSKKKNISLLSNISQSDPIAKFVDDRMKKNMNVILTENWLNSHCKTIKDLLLTIKFIKEEYSKLEPFINSLKYFYDEFPYDFINNRIIFTIVNLRKEYCFDVKIDVSYGQVKGKNIDVINHVGNISKTKVQQLFDQLQPNIERFHLFWQKLKRAHEL